MRNKTTLPRIQTASRYSIRRSQRQGMALLFVVSLILFITLLGTSFVVVSQQFAKSAKNRTRTDARGDSSRQTVERAFFDLVRGPDLSNTDSPLRGIDMLSDMYGYGVEAEVEAAVASTLIEGAIELTFVGHNAAPPELGTDLGPSGSQITPSQVVNAYNGQVATFTTGVMKDASVRIIGYSGSGNGNDTGLPYTVTIYPGINTPADLIGDTVILNGRPFGGWGAGGLAGATARLSTQAYMPRRMSDDPGATTATLGTFADYISTGVNESYDAFGFQNPFLAFAIDDERVSFNDPLLFMSVLGTSVEDEEKYANFRPVTNLYLQKVADPAIGNGDPTAVTVERINGWSNPTESLDVDNDGDGVEDSIWIDLGYPIQTDIDGRRYKPLVAFLVRDMDGRLNVNAHGNGYHLDRSLADIDRSITESALLLGGINASPATQELPRGHSMGPAEIDLGYFLNSDADYAALISDKYGEDGLPGIARLNDTTAANFRDPWNYFQQFGHPDLFATIYDPTEIYPNQFVGGMFSTAMDMHGRFVVGITESGGLVPVNYPSRSSVTNLSHTSEEIASSAYELSLSRYARHPWRTTDDGVTFQQENSDDTPYTPKEMERILRRFDRDSGSLPSRLLDLLPNSVVDSARERLTSEQWEVPALPGFDVDPGLLAPPFDPINPSGQLETGSAPVSVVARLFNLLYSTGTMTEQEANAAVQELLSFETRMGLPFDLNRPFGDGKDNNGNGVYDEHAQSTNPALNEAISGEYITAVDWFGQPAGSGTQLDFDPNIDGDNDVLTRDFNHLARQQFAMQLYVLALLATGDTDAPAAIADPTSVDVMRRTALAQWVINLVDYRDSDAINTPFEFDLHPFNGWDVDGFLGVGPGPDGILGNLDDVDDSIGNTQLALVWGLERPELLISETLATHDRRSQDLTSAGGGDMAGGDNDFDSRLVPRAAAFLELFHPWSQDDENQLLPEELTDGNNGINLRQTTIGGDPVWRLVAIRGNSPAANQNPTTFSIDEADVTRRIYFVQPDLTSTLNDTVGTASAFASSKVYFPSATGDLVITRGGYAAIGSSGVGTEATFGETFFGRHTALNWNRTRRIELDEGARTVGIFDPVDGSTETRNDVAVAVIDQHYDSGSGAAIARSLGLSDPVNGYPGTLTEIEDGFELGSTVDLPLDNDPSIQTDPRVANNGTTESFAEVHLQRLANPLMDYDPTLNPYLSIDTKTVDLVSFNGVEDDSASVTGNGFTDGPVLFASGERGRIADPLFDGTTPVRRMLWQHEESGTPISAVAAKPEFTTLGGADSHVFSFELYDSIGEVNEAYTDLAPRMPSNMTSGPNPPVGFTGFPWLNRPFANRMEVLDVPWPDSHQLLFLYTVPSFTPDTFQHLLDFQTIFDDTSRVPLGMAALMDFVNVPSRYTGTKIFLNDSVNPPFHALSQYREPGKINLNTMGNPGAGGDGVAVWEGLMGPMYGQAGSASGTYIDGSPTTYGASQASGSAFWGSMVSGGTGPADIDNPLRFMSEFEKTPTGITVPPPFDASMFRTEAGVTVFEAAGNLPYANPNRDSRAAHGIFQRLGDNTTTRSSVFSIWITVGRFEVDENGDLVGTSTGLVELGADTGKVQRSRGFYMIDRSIPVAFEPGKNHNIENMILVESIIE